MRSARDPGDLIVMPNRYDEHDESAFCGNTLARHENSRYRADFSDSGFFRLQPIDLYYVGGFGMMGWVEAKDYEEAAAGCSTANERQGARQRR